MPRWVRSFQHKVSGLVAEEPDNTAARKSATRIPEFPGREPFISVVIPAYNEERLLSETLKSIAVQDIGEPYEVIVVDNASTDGTRAIAEGFGARIVGEPNQGVGWAREAGFRAARAALVATTDADTVVPPNWLSHIAKNFNDDPKLVAFGGLYRYTNIGIMARFLTGLFSGPLFAVDRIFTGGSLLGGSMAVRKWAWQRVGGFNVSLRLGEDADLAIRLKSLGRVKLDARFVVYSSGRRFACQGFLKALYIYARTATLRMLTKKNCFTDLTVIR